MNKYLNNLNRIEVVVTMACTGKCIHCQEGDHFGYNTPIDKDNILKAIKRVIDNYDIKTVMTFGGEALLYPDITCAIHTLATISNVPKRQLITNGYFSNDLNKIKEVASNLKQSGVNEILLSVDAFHQDTIPLEPVKYFAKCLKENNIDTYLTPSWLVSIDHNNKYNIKTKEVLDKFKDLDIPTGEGNIIFASGNALKNLREYFGKEIDYSTPYDDDPYDITSLSFNYNGDVLNGNINEEDILDIIDSYEP